MKRFRVHSLFILSMLVLATSAISRAESQGNEYRGITDPFGDPANYEFAEDEKEDKEFFHLGRYLMLGVDFGIGFYTGGLGRTNTPAFMVGGKLIYYFDKSLAFEAALHYGRHETTIPTSATTAISMDTYLLPITLGLRYSFDTKNAPKAIAIANPYLVGGGGIYIRSETVLNNGGVTFQENDALTNNYGIYLGAGTEFNIYRRHLYLGLDFRYHLIFFNDESTSYTNPPQDDRAGDYISNMITLTYNF